RLRYLDKESRAHLCGHTTRLALAGPRPIKVGPPWRPQRTYPTCSRDSVRGSATRGDDTRLRPAVLRWAEPSVWLDPCCVPLSMANETQIILKVNGAVRRLAVEPWTSLLDALRDHLGLSLVAASSIRRRRGARSWAGSSGGSAWPSRRR